MKDDTIFTGRELRPLADFYEQAQRVRVSTGERIRAVLQGRDETWQMLGTVEDTGKTDDEGHKIVEWIDQHGAHWGKPDRVLKAILAKATDGPVPVLGTTYRRQYGEEEIMRKNMARSLPHQPIWNKWLSHVRGIGPTLGCKLLARLDPNEADHASSFWAYCGLATVPGVKYRCLECRVEKAWPEGYKVSGKHQALGTSRKCQGELLRIAGPEDGIRVAQPRGVRGEKATYDRNAKKLMYVVFTSFLKLKGPYEEFYRKEREKADRERPNWTEGRKYWLAVRKTQKLFLAHLWEVWRADLGLPVTDPWIFAHGGHDMSSKIGPWDMVDVKEKEF
jgi:hypothetical protein